MPHSFIFPHAHTSTSTHAIGKNTQSSHTCLFSNLFICSGLVLITILSPTHLTFIHGPSHLCSHLVPPISATTPQSWLLLLSRTPSFYFSPTVPSHILLSLSLHPLLSLSHITHPVCPINALDDTVPHLTSVFILHNSLWLRVLFSLCIDCLHPFQ